MFDISTASEDAFQIDPATLNINPDIKESHDAIQLVLPAQGIFLKHLRKRKIKRAFYRCGTENWLICKILNPVLKNTT